MARTIMSGRVPQLPAGKDTSAASYAKPKVSPFAANQQQSPASGQKRRPRVEIAPSTKPSAETGGDMSALAMLDEQRKVIHAQFVEKEKALRMQDKSQLSDDDFNNEMLAMQDDYRSQMGKFDPIAQNIASLDRLVESGQLNERAARKAQWSLVVSGDVVKEMFPDIDAGGAGSDDIKKHILRETISAEEVADWGETKAEFEKDLTDDFLKDVPTVGQFFKHKKWEKRKGADMMKAYLLRRKAAGYGGMTDPEKERFDVKFDADVRLKGDQYQWDPNSPVVKQSRSKGKLATAKYQNLLADYGEVNAGIQQFTAGLLAKQEVKQNAKEAKANPIVRTIGTQEEYDKLPSGTDYYDTNGVLYTKG